MTATELIFAFFCFFFIMPIFFQILIGIPGASKGFTAIAAAFNALMGEKKNNV